MVELHKAKENAEDISGALGKRGNNQAHLLPPNP